MMPTAFSPLGGQNTHKRQKNSEIMAETQKWVEAEPSTQSPFHKKVLVLVVKNYTKTDTKVSVPVQFCLVSGHRFINFVRHCSRGQVFSFSTREITSEEFDQEEEVNIKNSITQWIKDLADLPEISNLLIKKY